MFKKKYKRKKIRLARVLLKNAARKLTVNKLIVETPRKPNSARRKSIRGHYRNFKNVFSYIPGGSHPLKKFSNLLVRGKGPRDVPGVYTDGIRGVLDLYGLVDKTRRRSVYGTKKNLLK